MALFPSVLTCSLHVSRCLDPMCPHQYPLKPVALWGITLVFHPLLDAGDIIPCESSTVCRYCFLLRKKKKKGDMDSFVSDVLYKTSQVSTTNTLQPCHQEELVALC